MGNIRFETNWRWTMDYSVSSFQYLVLVAVAAVVSFSVARLGGWNLGDPFVTVATIVLAIAVFSLLVFCLQYVRGRYGADIGTSDGGR